jgi:hypothetical protein
MGITDGRQDFDFNQLITCSICGKYGRFNVFMTYTVLSLFFIPTFKWNRHYYVQTSCCGTVYELDPEIGKMIARGEEVEILPSHLTQVSGGRGFTTSYRDAGSADMRQLRILIFVRNVERDFDRRR